MSDVVSTLRRPGRRFGKIGAAIALIAALVVGVAPVRDANGGWPWSAKHSLCGHPNCQPDQCVLVDGWAGQWFWMRSPEQELRVVMGLYNRYCIRCHGIDGRGVCAIPDVPDFTDPRWQTSRTDPQVVNILMDGRGAVMPTFRGTLSIEETWAMARYLRRFVPGTEVPRPDVGRTGTNPPPGAPTTPPSVSAGAASASPPTGTGAAVSRDRVSRN
jgi:mono/diheme cytochrome c family protein